MTLMTACGHDVFHLPDPTVGICLDAIAGLVLRVMQEIRIDECFVVQKSGVDKAALRIRETDVQNTFLQIIDMIDRIFFCDKIIAFFQMEGLKVIFKNDFSSGVNCMCC